MTSFKTAQPPVVTSRRTNERSRKGRREGWGGRGAGSNYGGGRGLNGGRRLGGCFIKSRTSKTVGSRRRRACSCPSPSAGTGRTSLPRPPSGSRCSPVERADTKKKDNPWRRWRRPKLNRSVVELATTTWTWMWWLAGGWALQVLARLANGSSICSENRPDSSISSSRGIGLRNSETTLFLVPRCQSRSVYWKSMQMPSTWRTGAVGFQVRHVLNGPGQELDLDAVLGAVIGQHQLGRLLERQRAATAALSGIDHPWAWIIPRFKGLITNASSRIWAA